MKTKSNRAVACIRFVQRFLARLHTHHWEGSVWNKWGVAVEEECKCGASRWHSFEHLRGFGEPPDWQDGRHPNRPSLNIQAHTQKGRRCAPPKPINPKMKTDMDTPDSPLPLPAVPCSAFLELADEHELSALSHIDEGDRESAKLDMDTAHAIRQLVAALTDANDQCRSAMQIAQRSGEATNWPAFAYQLGVSLKRQHAAMYPPNDQAHRLARSPADKPKEQNERND